LNIAESLQQSKFTSNDNSLTVSSKNSKKSPVLRLPENTKGPADLVKVPDQQTLDSLINITDIMKFVDEGKSLIFQYLFRARVHS
jgi:hypothetical protein